MLRNKLPEIEILEEDPFKYDKLNRRPCANTFCSLVKLYSGTGCVIALNGGWGTGKTTFVKMLIQLLKNEGGHPLYFNAWENDYISDPLIALLAELKDVNVQSSKWKDVIAKGGKIMASITTSAAKTVIKNKLGIDSDVISAGIDEVGKLLKNDIEDYSKQKTTFADFRKSLQDYIADNTTEEVPVVFFVDELDRCSPKFAVLVLERIKHLFDIPNIIFVLSVNKKQLAYAIQGYYGSSNIDADNYLRRFIDIEFTLPPPKNEAFCQYLYDTYDFGEFFKNKDRIVHNEFRSDEENFMIMANNLVSSMKLDLRTIDKIFVHTRLALKEFSSKNYVVPDVFFLLCFLKIANTDLYHNIIEEKYSAQQLLNEIEVFLPSKLLDINDFHSVGIQMTYTIASFIIMYSLDDGGREREHFINQNNGSKCLLQPKLLNQETFEKAILRSHNNSRGDIPLSHITKKIELQQGVLGQNN